MKQYNSVQVARYIIAIANSRGIGINMTKVQKLLYIAYGVFMAVREERLLNELPQAWPYGPVFPKTRSHLLNEHFYSIGIADPEFSELREDMDLNSLLNSVFAAFGSWTAGQLTEWSHQDGSPWEFTTIQEGFTWGTVIPDILIKGYFKLILKRNDS